MALDKKASIIVGAVAVLAIAVSGALLYVQLGSTQARPGAAVAGHPEPAPGAMPPAPAAGQASGKTSLTLEAAADRLSKRLQQQNGSAEDWTLLARTYVELRQYPQAARAFDEAMKKAPDDAKLRSEAALAQQAAGAAPAPR